MSSVLSNILSSFTEIQTELRKLTLAAAEGGGTPMPLKLFGCRLLHWDPKLGNFWAEVVHRGRPASFIVYQPLDVRIGSNALNSALLSLRHLLIPFVMRLK